MMMALLMTMTNPTDGGKETTKHQQRDKEDVEQVIIDACRSDGTYEKRSLMRCGLDVSIKTCVESDDVIASHYLFWGYETRISLFLTRIRIHDVEKCFFVVRDLLILN